MLFKSMCDMVPTGTMLSRYTAKSLLYNGILDVIVVVCVRPLFELSADQPVNR